MKKSILSLALCAALAVLLAGCGNTRAPSSAPATSSRPQSQASSASQSTAPQAAGTYTIVNETGAFSISGLTVAEAGSGVWSADALNGGSLSHGGSIQGDIPGASTIDISFTGSDADIVHTVYGVALSPDCLLQIAYGQGGYGISAWYADDSHMFYEADTYGPSGRPLTEDQLYFTFMLYNNTGSTVVSVQLAPAGSGMWSGDVLGSTTLPDGDGLALDTPGAFTIDMEVLEDTGTYHVLYGIFLTEECEVEIVLGQGGWGVIVTHPDGSNEYFPADTNDEVRG